ncbi:MAG TPA: hypothetical protein VD886_22310 [Herpetosiphonaceae bacterium]|nr:hypothetical protein [Herpetosiphonaceae bacterium]
MAKEKEALVTRTYRAAIKSGDDYITIEETISLPPTASDNEIAEAVDTGLRIFRAQQAAVEAQMSAIRDAHPAMPLRIADPDAPASEKQRSYMEYLVTTLELSDAQMQATLREHNTTYETLTKSQASEIIDRLKGQVDGRGSAPAGDGSAAAPAQAELVVAAPANAPASNGNGALASTRQLAALQRVANQHGVDLAAEVRARFGAGALDDLTVSEAGALLQDLQNRPIKK